LNTKSYRMG